MNTLECFIYVNNKVSPNLISLAIPDWGIIFRGLSMDEKYAPVFNYSVAELYMMSSYLTLVFLGHCLKAYAPVHKLVMNMSSKEAIDIINRKKLPKKVNVQNVWDSYQEFTKQTGIFLEMRYVNTAKNIAKKPIDKIKFQSLNTFDIEAMDKLIKETVLL